MTTTVTATAEVMKKPTGADHIHYLPCSVNFTGETEVDERFRKLTEKNEDTGVLTGSFRGFPLEGRSVSLPEKYTGVGGQESGEEFSLMFFPGVVLEGVKAGLTTQDRKTRVTSTFSELTYWNYDRSPGPADPWHQALQWTRVAEVLHSD